MSLNLDIDSLPPEKVEAAITRLEAMKAQRATENKLAHYRPYPKQVAFHAAGARCRERLLIAANQSGKSLAGAMECAMHATGRYPDWWKGRRFDKPTIGWGAGTTNETTRDTMQRILVGRPGQPGTAAIPKDAIIDLVSARGTPDLLDSIKVTHVSGGVSVISLKSYQRGRESFQGETLDYLWFDEEPPADIFTEGLTRTNVNQGPVWVTFTPLLGMSETVRRKRPRSSQAIRHMNGRHAPKASRRLGAAASSRYRKRGLRLSTASFPGIGRALAAWISAGIIRLRRLSWCGIATPTPSMSPRLTASAR